MYMYIYVRWQVEEALHRMDARFGELMDGIHRRGLLNCVNIVVVSDHGTSFPLPQTHQKYKIRAW